MSQDEGLIYDIYQFPNMSWDFYKPNVWKVALTLVFIGLSVFEFNFMNSQMFCMFETRTCTLVYLPQFNCGRCQEEVTQSDYVYGNFLNAMFDISIIATPGMIIMSFPILFPVIGVPAMVLYHYTVSCLIFWVAEKIMKSRKYFSKKIM
jgi:hypothetical protein